MNPPRCYISYAWETDVQKNIRLQQWIRNKLYSDLQILGVPMFLDIMHLNYNIQQNMAEQIDRSSIMLIICTPRYRVRIQDLQSNVRFELDRALNRNKRIIPIIYENNTGNIFDVLPVELQNYLAIDFTNPETYFKNMVGFAPLGIIPSIFGIEVNMKYEFLVRDFS